MIRIRLVLVSLMTSFYLFLPPPALSAEAGVQQYVNDMRNWHSIARASSYLTRRLSARSYHEAASYQSLLDLVRGQIMTNDEATMARLPPQTSLSGGIIVAQEFVKAEQFFLTSLSAFEEGISEVIRLAASDISGFLSLPENQNSFRGHHLIQNAFDEVYFLWPDRRYEPADSLSYRFDVNAKTRYHSPEFHDFTGTLSLSFATYEARLALENQHDDFAVAFDITTFHEQNFIQTTGHLSHQNHDYDAALIMGYSALPDAALQGYVATLAPLPNTPHYIEFRNFSLPE